MVLEWMKPLKNRIITKDQIKIILQSVILMLKLQKFVTYGRDKHSSVINNFSTVGAKL